MNVQVYDIIQKPPFIDEEFVHKFFRTTHESLDTLVPIFFTSVSIKLKGKTDTPIPDLNNVSAFLWQVERDFTEGMNDREKDAVEEFQTLLDYSFPRPKNKEFHVFNLICQALASPFLYMAAMKVSHEEYPPYIHYMVKAGLSKDKKQLMFLVHTKFSSIPCYRPMSLKTFEEQFNNQIYSEEHITSSVFTGKTNKDYKNEFKPRYILEKISIVHSTH